MPFITVNSIQCHYQRNIPATNKPKQGLLFVHGAGGSHQNWHFQLAHMSEDYLLIALDLPGHGLSEGNALDRIEAYSQFIKDFSELVLDTPFFLVGHSMGGAIAMDFAFNYPQKLAGLILVGTGSRLRVMPQLLETFKNNEHFLGLEKFLYSTDTQPATLLRAKEEMESVHPSVFFADFTACNLFDATDRLENIKVPTLVISADMDVMTPIKYGQYLANKIPNSRMKIIAGAGHMMMQERPKEFNQTVESFMEELDKIGDKGER
ncbi:alpha/beta hydrolase [Desulfotomaculum defluvii]